MRIAPRLATLFIVLASYMFWAAPDAMAVGSYTELAYGGGADDDDFRVCRHHLVFRQRH